MKRSAITTLAAAAAFALATQPVLASGARPRPSDVPPAEVVTAPSPSGSQVYNDYATPERVYESRRACVHYVVLGIDAPPLNDGDGDGVPDYVEHVGAAADTAIDYYASRGFAPIVPDTGGPDARPDIYISRFEPGIFGVSFPAAETQKGAFIVASNALDPSPGRSLGSLDGTIAHELFHLVQFSYYDPNVDPTAPAWALEGSAAAMETRVFPEADDIVNRLQTSDWLAAPEGSLTDESYGAQLLWRYIDEHEPRVLPAFLARIGASSAAQSAAAELVDTYHRVTGHSFAALFGRFALSTYFEYETSITPLRDLGRRERTAGHVASWALDPLLVSPAAHSISVRVTRGHAQVTLAYKPDGGTPGLRMVAPKAVKGSLVFTLPRDNVSWPVLVVANGDPSAAAAYTVAVA